MQETPDVFSEKKKPCPNCGAELTYKPGTHQLGCGYCGYEEFIETNKTSLEELELAHYLELVGQYAHTETLEVLHCKNCGAQQHSEENYQSLHCIYCSEPLIKEESASEQWIRPGGLIPFQLDAKKGRQLFKNWVKGIWFAPNSLKKAALDPEAMHGVYLPYWTFDADLTADYRGQRGDYYYETQRVKTKNGVQTQQVRKTRWRSASGRVSGFVDDVLVNAAEKRAEAIPAKISHWRMDDLVGYDTKYLSGFVTEKYTVSLKEGHKRSFAQVKSIAHNWIRRDIGGDTQRISSADINLANETFKHVLLPIFISNYTFKGKRYHFYINGQTGALTGKRPYSFWKIFFLVLFIGVLILILAKFAG
ncbi:DNA helicase PriA [Sediminicola luteus]|uniref:DNA helicase PriA n=1 Tax=Sediminicola luteus TaxID=319238 RepID=A0A2A4G5A3_9FLAO|nr:DNA helicase PriA [Sediminicola luteus]PCE62922.1 DNA helicase PriA [Sediminicola luteus]